MGTIRKAYRLSDDKFKIIDDVKREKNFKTETEALAYILNDYKKRKEDDNDKEVLADLVVETMLHEYDIRFLMKARGKTMHPVIQESEKAFLEVIEKNKQIKDNEELKRG